MRSAVQPAAMGAIRVPACFGTPLRLTAGMATVAVAFGWTVPPTASADHVLVQTPQVSLTLQGSAEAAVLATRGERHSGCLRYSCKGFRYATLSWSTACTVAGGSPKQTFGIDLDNALRYRDGTSDGTITFPSLWRFWDRDTPRPVYLSGSRQVILGRASRCWLEFGRGVATGSDDNIANSIQGGARPRATSSRSRRRLE